MNTLYVISMHDLTAELPSLTGVARARQLLAKLIQWTATESSRGTIILDFSEIEIASASFLRESVLAFRDYVRAYQPDAFPILANVAETVREEFDVLLQARGEAMLACRLDASGTPRDPFVIGVLEPSLSHTLSLIRERGQIALSDLPAETKASTWSNRIASLIRQGFVIPMPETNKRVYRFVLS